MRSKYMGGESVKKNYISMLDFHAHTAHRISLTGVGSRHEFEDSIVDQVSRHKM